MCFWRMRATGAFLLCVGLVAVLCSCAPTSKKSQRLHCTFEFAVDPAESSWKAPVLAVYRQVLDVCNEHGATISSSSMTNCHDGRMGQHSVNVIVRVTTDEGARLVDALSKRIRCAEEAVFLEKVFISWWHTTDYENGGWLSARFVRGSKEPQVEMRVQETVPLDD